MPPLTISLSTAGVGCARAILFSCLLAMMAFPCVHEVHAQGGAPQPPLVIPGPGAVAPSNGLNIGSVYVNGAFRYRTLHSIRFTLGRHTGFAQTIQGVPAFGSADTGGTVTYPSNPTNNVGDPADTSGIWTYEDGTIVPQAGIGPTWTSADVNLGHEGGGNPIDIGAFTINDSDVQTVPSPPTSFDTTTALLFSGTLADPADAWTETAGRNVTTITDGRLEDSVSPNAGAPSIEAGFTYGNFLDFFFGVSWFTTDRSWGTTLPSNSFVGVPTFTDAFLFTSDDTNNFPAATGFDSETPAAGGGNVNNSYFIFPVGIGGDAGTLPVRTFSSAVLVPDVQSTETFNQSIDLSIVEFRPGGRAWFALSELCRMGASMGPLFSTMSYEADSRQVITSDVLVTDPITAEVIFNPGDVILSERFHDDGSFFNFGCWFAADFEMGAGNFFFRSSAEYDVYFRKFRKTQIAETSVNMNGFSATVGGGLRF